MDLATLTQELSALLLPFLPYLLDAGEKASEAAEEDFERQNWSLLVTKWIGYALES
jgi:hypothetical protein